SISAMRLPSERPVYRVIASATPLGVAADQDLPVALRSGSTHPIAEAPHAPFCTAQATASRKQQMRTARSRVRSCARARGVADPDPHHFDGNHDGVGCET